MHAYSLLNGARHERLPAMRDEKLEAVLIGNAAAAMQGAPVTTLDFDFMFRDPSSKRPAGNSATPRPILGRRKPNAPAPGDPMPAKKRSRPRAKPASHTARLAALRKESDRQLEELIRRRLAMPLEQRMNFLRKRLPGGGSCL